MSIELSPIAQYSALSTQHSWLRGRLAAGKEPVGDDLGGLAARHAGAPAEVGAALPIAGLARPAAGVAADHPMQRDALDPEPERVAGGHIGKRLLRRRDHVLIIDEAGDDFRQLAARHI